MTLNPVQLNKTLNRFGISRVPYKPTLDISTQRLCIAILFDAMDTIHKYHTGHKPTKKNNRLYTDTYKWFFLNEDNEDPKYPFNFSNICYVLGLDKSSVRKEVMKYVKIDVDGTSTIPNFENRKYKKLRVTVATGRNKELHNNDYLPNV